jgi:hypothetical protein
MRMQFLTIAAALASVFAAQSVFAFQKELPPSYSKPTAGSYKHHKHHMKHHMKKTKAENTAAPAANGAAALS